MIQGAAHIRPDEFRRPISKLPSRSDSRPDRIPTRLLECPSAHRRLSVAGRPGSRCGLHGNCPDWHGTGCCPLFWSDIRRIGSAWLRQAAGRKHDPRDARLGWLVILGSVPIVILGLLAQDLIETSLRNLYITAAMLIGFGVVLGLCDRSGRKIKTLPDLTWRDGMSFGLAQAMALIPATT
jgi:hypothetical protein